MPAKEAMKKPAMDQTVTVTRASGPSGSASWITFPGAHGGSPELLEPFDPSGAHAGGAGRGRRGRVLGRLIIAIEQGRVVGLVHARFRVAGRSHIRRRCRVVSHVRCCCFVAGRSHIRCS